MVARAMRDEHGHSDMADLRASESNFCVKQRAVWAAKSYVSADATSASVVNVDSTTEDPARLSPRFAKERGRQIDRHRAAERMSVDQTPCGIRLLLDEATAKRSIASA